MTFSGSKFPILDNGFEQLGVDCVIEPRLCSAGAKIRRSTSTALDKMAAAESRTRANVIEAAIESHLRTNGFLK